MKVAFQLDPLPQLDPAKDTSLLLASFALGQGWKVYFYEPSLLQLSSQGVHAWGHEISLEKAITPQFIQEEKQCIDLSSCDVVWVRQNPPYSMEYIVPTYILERLPSRVKVVNSPAALRSYPEKIIPFLFPQFQPETCFTWDIDAATNFCVRFTTCVVKPAFAFGGRGVLRVDIAKHRHTGTLKEVLEDYCREVPGPWIFQEYLGCVETQGDKRILLLDGEILGAYARIPAQGNFVANVAAGGKAQATMLTSQEKAICAALGAFLRQQGLRFVGIDVIDERLIEVNTTSPMSLVTLNQLYGPGYEARVWQQILNV